MSSLTRKLVILLASYAIVASALVTYFKAPLRPVLYGGFLVVAVTVLQHFAGRR